MDAKFNYFLYDIAYTECAKKSAALFLTQRINRLILRKDGFPQEQVRDLVKKARTKRSQVPFWTALIKFLDQHEPVEAIDDIDHDDTVAATMSSLQRQWDKEFKGNAIMALEQKIEKAEKVFSKAKYYGRIMSIIQSSGMGKSRLVDELGKETLSISFTLRENAETGFPPGDPEVTSYLKEGFDEDEVTRHVRIISLLVAAFDYGMQIHLSKKDLMH
jgi:hypothetical protein